MGLGQEFDMEFFLQSREDYRRIREQLQQQNVLWLLPYVEEHFRRQYLPEMEAEIEKGLQKLAEVLEKKSYFVVSSSLNHKLAEVPWKKMLLKKSDSWHPVETGRKNSARTGVRKASRQ